MSVFLNILLGRFWKSLIGLKSEGNVIWKGDPNRLDKGGLSPSYISPLMLDKEIETLPIHSIGSLLDFATPCAFEN